jgi:hypothetical protein
MNRNVMWSVGTGILAAMGCVLLRSYLNGRGSDTRFSDGRSLTRREQEARIDDTMDDSFPASDPPARGNFTAAGGPMS